MPLRDLAASQRFWFVTMAGSVASLLILGIPSAIIPNPIFTRIVPTQPFNVVVWLISGLLLGVTAATYAGVPSSVRHREHGEQAGLGLGGVAAYFAIACPVCNKLVVAVLGLSGALTVFAPLQPVIGAASVLLLAGTLAWRLRILSRGCPRCVVAAAV